MINGSGAQLIPNLLQVIYAMAVGFTFVMIVVKTKSLVPCIITHSIFNSLSAFANEAVMTPQKQIVSGVLIAIVAGGYALYIALVVKVLCNTFCTLFCRICMRLYERIALYSLGTHMIDRIFCLRNRRSFGKNTGRLVTSIATFQ